MTTIRFLAQAVILRCTKNLIDFPWVFENLNAKNFKCSC